MLPGLGSQSRASPMPSLGRPPCTLAARRTVAGQLLPEAHRKRAEIGAAEGAASGARKVEDSARDERTPIDHRDGDGTLVVRERKQRSAGQGAMRHADGLRRVDLTACGVLPEEARS